MDFYLLNLRELSSAEQLALNGGSALCDIDKCECDCPCKCDKYDPSQTSGKESSKAGARSTYARKQKEAISGPIKM